MHLNKQKVPTLSRAAVLADEYALTHKIMFTAPRQEARPPTTPTTASHASRVSLGETRSAQETRECFYCHRPGHLIAVCPVLRNKKAPSPVRSKSINLIHSMSQTNSNNTNEGGEKPDQVYAPFVSGGNVSLTGEPVGQMSVTILRDTGAAQSLVLADSLPWSHGSYCGSNVLLQGLGATPMSVPLHWVWLKSKLVSGTFSCWRGTNSAGGGSHISAWE